MATAPIVNLEFSSILQITVLILLLLVAKL
jgi:hypothetical protein